MIAKIFSQLKFEVLDMEKSYRKFQTAMEVNMLGLLNALFTVVILSLIAIGFGLNVDLKMNLVSIGLFVLCTIALIIRRKCYLLHRLLLLGVIIGFLVSIIIILIKQQKNVLIRSFLVGNTWGIAETIIILSFKQTRFCVGALALAMSFKMIALREQLFGDPECVLVVLLISIFTLTIYMYNNVLDRKTFKIIYESRDKLKKFQDLLSNDFPSNVVIVNSAFDCILYSNQCFRAKFKIHKDEEAFSVKNIGIFEKLIIEPDTTAIQSDDNTKISLPGFLQNLSLNSRKIQEDSKVLTLSATYTDDPDTTTYYEIKLRQVLWENKCAYAILLNDVSDKQMVVALRMADKQKDRVIATLSHELRTPINGILGLLEMVKARIADTLSLNYLEYAKSCSNLLLYLVNSILDLSQLRHNSLRIVKTSFSLDELLGEVKSLYMFHSQQKGVEFVVEKGEDVPDMIYTDKYRLIEVLINLVGNAMKFTFEGSITLSIAVDEECSHKLVFSVTDTGIGIKDNDKSKLFQMFGKITYDNKNINSQGVGLGLTIANELVKALNDKDHQQKIEFESEHNKGSRFWFKVDTSIIEKSDSKETLSDDDICSQLLDSLDIKERAPGSIKQLHSNIERYSKVYKGNYKTGPQLSSIQTQENETLSCRLKLLSTESNRAKKALIVDDNPFNLMAASFILEQLGFTITKAFNGKECIRLLEKSLHSEDRYSVIITDIQMPVMDGLEMSRIIEQRILKGEMYPIPIVAATAQSLNRQERARYGEYGIKYAIEKPINKEEVKNILDDLF